MSNLVEKNLAKDFWGDMEPSDFVVPRVSIGQGTSKKGEPGHFNFNSGNSFKELKGCKLIVPRKTRVLYEGAGKSRCASDNYYQPSGRIKNPVSESCLSCPVGQWGEDPLKDKLAKETGATNYNSNKPLCCDTYNLLMADQDWGLFFISFQKTQLKVVQEKLFSQLKYQFGSLPPFHVQFDMSLDKIAKPNAVYYSVVFSNFTEAEDKDKGTEIYAAWKSKAEDVLAKQHEAMDLDKEDDDVVPF